MTALMTLEIVLSLLNAVLGLVLAAVYARNHRDVRSPFTLGLLLFSAFVVLHSAVSVYADVTMMASASAQVAAWRLVESVVEAFGLAALCWATLR